MPIEHDGTASRPAGAISDVSGPQRDGKDPARRPRRSGAHATPRLSIRRRSTAARQSDRYDDADTIMRNTRASDCSGRGHQRDCNH